MQRVIAQISWRQNIAVMERLDYPEARLGTSNKPFKTGIPFGWGFFGSPANIALLFSEATKTTPSRIPALITVVVLC